MGKPDFYTSRINKEMPADYKHLLDQPVYETMLELVTKYFEEKGELIVGLDKGFLTVEDDSGKEMKYGFDNLTRAFVAAKEEDRESIVYAHFNKVHFSESAYNFYFKDYEHAKPHLKVVVKHEEILQHKYGHDIVKRMDFPGTCTVLVFDYDNQLRFLRNVDVIEWKVSTDELFSEALSNVASEPVTASTLTHPDGFTFYSFLSGDFAAAFMINLEANADFAMGEYGTLVAIPTKGAAFVSALKDKDVMKRIAIIAPVVVEFFQKEPGNITTDFYWYYKGRFDVFPTRNAGDGLVRVVLPSALEVLLQSNEC